MNVIFLQMLIEYRPNFPCFENITEFIIVRSDDFYVVIVTEPTGIAVLLTKVLPFHFSINTEVKLNFCWENVLCYAISATRLLNDFFDSNL